MARLAAVLVAALVGGSVVPVVAMQAPPAAAAESSSSKFEVVGQVPLFDGATPPGEHKADGWLVMDSGTRRGYQLFRPNLTDTVIASFDLDTFEHRRTVTLPGVGVAGGCPAGPPCTSVGKGAPGDVVWAVDEARGRLFLAGATTTPTTNGNSTEFVRSLTIAQIDEARFDAGNPIDGPTGFLRHLRIPATQAAELVDRDIFGLEFVPDGAAGKLIGLWTSPAGTVHRYVHDHWLAQWDVATGFGDWTYLLTGCARAPLNSAGAWTFEIPILRGKEAIYLGCQASQSSPSTQGIAAAVKIPLQGGNPNPDVTLQQTFQLPRGHANVLADPQSERLLFQTDLRGSSWWVFDGPSSSWVGAIGSTVSSYPMTAGIDRTTGRLYTLVPDHVNGSDPPEAALGGFGYSDTRLTPAPQTRNVMPELDYPGQFKMLVDPAAPGRDRRIFLRRGSSVLNVTPDFPGKQNDQPRPVENHILVIRDREPVAELGSFGDVDNLTVDRPEQEGVTEVSYGGVARGFGARVLLTGGVTAAVSRTLDDENPATGNFFTNGFSNPPTPPLIVSCYRNDRELTFGSAEAKTSDLTTSGQSVALAADESTKNDLGEPAARCPAPGMGFVPKNPDDAQKRVNPTTTTTEPGATTTTTTALVNPPPVVALPDDYPQFLAQMLDSTVGQKWDSNGDSDDDYTSECVGDENPGNTHFEKDNQEYDAHARCEQSEERAAAASSAAVVPHPDVPIRIAESSVDTKVERDPEDGIVSSVTSTVRGLEILGVGSIGLIRTTATSYAKGRPGTPARRGARTEFTRTFCAIDLPTLQRSGCGDPKPAVDALNKAISRFGEARLRAPDPDYKKGSPGGYQAAIQRDGREAFTDRFVTRDASMAVPGLELIFYANDSPTKGAGRQVIQFAGVEASSTYAIKCLLGARPDGKDCNGAPGSDPSNLTLLLVDGFEKPLAGGVFKVHKDVNGDGAIGVDDPVMTNGTCMTDDGGTGNCSWEGITPGDYVVEQATAPAGYAIVEDFALSLPSGQNVDVTFTNLRAVAGVLLGLVDGDSGDPLAGAEFELYQDDGDGTVSGADKLYATCKTDDVGLCEFELPAGSPAAAAAEDPKLPCFGQAADGANESGLEEDLTGALEGQLDGVLADPNAAKEICVAEVPLGAYVVHQKTAPADYDAADDLPVDFELPGQVALLVFANGLTAIPGTAGSESAPADPGEAPREIPPVENTVVDPGSATPQPIVQTSPIQRGGPLQRAINRIVSAPASAIRWLFSNPRELGLMLAVWTVIWLPCYLAERRRVLRSLRDPSISSPAIGATIA